MAKIAGFVPSQYCTELQVLTSKVCNIKYESYLLITLFSGKCSDTDEEFLEDIRNFCRMLFGTEYRIFVELDVPKNIIKSFGVYEGLPIHTDIPPCKRQEWLRKFTRYEILSNRCELVYIRNF
jgi:hypothetical protein